MGHDSAFGGNQFRLGNKGFYAVVQRIHPGHVRQFHITAVCNLIFYRSLQIDKDRHGDHDRQKGHQCRHVIADTDGQPDAGRCPQSRRGGKARHLLSVADDDRTHAQKSDSRYDLSAHAHGIAGESQHGHGVQSHQRRHGRPQTHQNVGSETGGPSVMSPLQADQSPQQNRQKDPKRRGPHIQFRQRVPNNIHTDSL